VRPQEDYRVYRAEEKKQEVVCKNAIDADKKSYHSSYHRKQEHKPSGNIQKTFIRPQWDGSKKGHQAPNDP
jgi:hypothetical protein